MKIFVEWGRIVVGEKEFHDIIYSCGKFREREYEKIKAKYGTGHVVDEEEAKLLLDGKPSEVIIGNGFSGSLKLTEKAEGLLRKESELKIMESQEAVREINEKLSSGKEFSALVHSTC